MINVNQLTSQLAKMPDPMLQKYAAMHKNDPYTVALAIGESNRRKAMRAAAQGRAPEQQPKVVDQDIAEMAGVDPMGNMTGALPENMGIGRLPALNMAPISKAEGGIIGFAEGGTKPPEIAISDLITKYAQEYKLDPALLTQIVGVESGKKAAAAKNPKSSAHGLGQLVDTMWGKMGGGERTDPEVQVRNAAKLLRSNTDSFIRANGRTPDASESYTTWFLGDPTGRAVLRADPNASVEDVIRKADPKRADSVIAANKSVLKDKKVGDVLQWSQGKMSPLMGASTPVPFGVTQATPVEEVGTPKEDARLASLIPRTATGLAALGGTAAVGKEALTVPMFRPGTTLGQALGKVGTAASVPLTTGLTGLALSKGAANALSNATPEQLEQLEGFNADPSGTSFAAAIQRVAKEKTPPATMPYGQQMGNTGELIGDFILGRKGRGPIGAATSALFGTGTSEKTIPPMKMGDDLEATDRSFGQIQPTPEIKKIDEPTTPATEGAATGGGGLSSLFKDPAFLMGLRLMASQNPRFLGAAGEAGIGAVGDLAAAEKASSEADYRKAMGKYYGAYAGAIERGAKEKNEVQQAEKSAQEALDTWAKNNKMALLQSPDLYDRMRDKYRRDAYNVYGIKMPTMAAEAPDAAGGGLKFLGVRP